MTTTVLTPFDLAAPTQAGPRVYRKQVLKKGRINYPLRGGGKRVVEFTDEYLRDLAAAYTGGAYDTVPFQLAGPDNAHNEDPRNYGGRVIGAEVTPEGLDLILELAEDTAELVERTGRRLGVSARIKEQLEHVDGRRFKRAIRHVLGTLDPRMTGMSPWEPVDLAHNDTDEVVDLSDLTYMEDRIMPRGRLDLAALADEDAEALTSYAIAAGIDLSEALEDDDDEPDLGSDATPPAADDELEPLSDEELDALLDAAVADAGADDRELEPLTLSEEAGLDDLDLAAGLSSDAHDDAAVARRDAAEARYELARERYGAAGVPPAALDLARPILELAEDDDTLELSSPATGDAIDVHGIVVGLLDTIKGTVDLSGELGRGHEDDDGEAETDLADRWTDYLSINTASH